MTTELVMWWLAGWPVGAVLGWIAHDLHRTRNIARELDKKVDVILEHEQLDPPTPPPEKNERGAVRPDYVAYVGLALVVAMTVWAVIASTVASGKVSDTQESLSRVVACQQEYNADNAAVLAQRAEWADQDRKALGDMTAALMKSRSNEAVEAALRTYLDTAAANDRKRKANPLPKNTCPEPKEETR